MEFSWNVREKIKNEALPKVKKELISNIDASTNEIKNKIITINNMLIDKVKEVNSHLETAKIKSSNDIDEINRNITIYKNDLTSVESIFSSLKKININ